MITEEEKTHAQDRANQAQASSPDASEWLKERKQELSRLFDQKARELSQRAQNNVAFKMQHYESALRAASTDLHEHEEGQLSSIADAAANHINDSARYIENADPRELANEGANIVRSSPLLALGASLLLGLAVGRLTRSASKEPQSESPPTNA